ncbi:hypothetical protein [Massilia violaceinigra]|nr:hypothetical protein [Massilia violaceinigra]
MSLYISQPSLSRRVRSVSVAANYPQAGYGKLFAAWALGSSPEELV